jgi:tRNA/rRNA methyltransferase
VIARHAKDQEVALVFGNETYGLSNSELTKCQLLVTIPANPDYPSLNLAAAVQLLSYEVALASESVQSLVVEPMGDLASLEEIEQFYQHLETTLVKIGFLDPRHPKKLMPRLRRLFARSRLEKEEINILRGILKEVNKG